MVEHVSVASDRRSIVFSANGGADADDIDRRHIFRVCRALAYLTSDATRPPAPAVRVLDGGEGRRLTDDRIPPDFPTSKLVAPEPVKIEALDGLELRGQLFKAAPSGTRLPAILFVHGGPAQQMLLGWHYRSYYATAYAINQYLASRGFLVLSLNYRQGIGYGFEFHHPDPVVAASPHDDIIAAARYLRARPDVDPKRIGIWGSSYGGYLTAQALLRNSDVFGAGVDIHGVHDLVLKELAKVEPPADDGDHNPSVPVWTSPVLMIHGDDDRTVPFSETIELERQLIGQQVAVETRVIPDDVHNFLLFRSWKTVAEATAEYFERVLLNRAK
jgi:dipeptidyl aminopeptidase/acylaminoacyl peptidase